MDMTNIFPRRKSYLSSFFPVPIQIMIYTLIYIWIRSHYADFELYWLKTIIIRAAPMHNDIRE